MTWAITYACLTLVGGGGGLSFGPTQGAPRGDKVRVEAEAVRPEVIHLAPRPDVHDRDCAAQGPQRGVLDWTSPLYRRIEVRKEEQLFEETAFLRESDVTVSVRIGGCAHYGAAYVVGYDDMAAEEDLPYHVGRALRIVTRLAFREGAVTFLDRISPVLDRERPGLKERGRCLFPVGDVSSVSCDVDRDETGRLRVEIVYDIAL